MNGSDVNNSLSSP